MCLSDALAKFAYEHSATGTATPLFAMLSWSDAVVEEMLSEQKFLERDVAECVPPSDVVAPPRIAFPSVSQRWTRAPRSRARRSHALAFSLTLPPTIMLKGRRYHDNTLSTYPDKNLT